MKGFINNKYMIKKDFGSYIKNNGLTKNGNIAITESFTPLSIVLFPGGLASITANIEDMLVSFDFDQEILMTFLSIFNEFNLIDTSLFSKQLKDRKGEPLVVPFIDQTSLLKITGIILTCELGDTEVSLTTREEFTPLLVKEIKIVESPVGVLVSKFLEVM